MPAFISPFLCIIDICVDPHHIIMQSRSKKHVCAVVVSGYILYLTNTYVLDILHTHMQHLRLLEDMVKDYALGEYLLLVGNQGVSKNKIVDRFLHLLNLPREYLQLHRSVESTSSCTGL